MNNVRIAFVGLLALPMLTAHLVVSQTGPQSAAMYRIVPEESSVLIHVGTAGMLGFLGHEHEIVAPAISGTVDLDRLDPARSTVVVEFQTSALRVTGKGEPPGDVPEVQRTMLSDQVLDVEHHRSIVFRSRQITAGKEATGRIPVVVRGALTLRGVTRSVIVTGTVSVAGETLTMKGAAQLAQTDFGLRPITAGGGAVRVKDQLDVEMVIVARASTR